MRTSKRSYFLSGFEDLNGAGFVVGSRGIVVVDSTLTLLGANTLAGVIDELYPDKKILYLVNTHWHGDHIFGNQVFKERGAKIIAHENTRTYLETYPNYVQQIADSHPRYRRLLADIELVLPDEVFTTEMHLDLGDTTLTLQYRPGHTDSDITVRVSDTRDVFVGDLVYVDVNPTLVFSDPDRWIESLRALEAENISKILPGHGPVSGAAEIKNFRQELENSIAKVKQLNLSGVTGPAEIAETVGNLKPACVGRLLQWFENQD